MLNMLFVLGSDWLSVNETVWNIVIVNLCYIRSYNLLVCHNAFIWKNMEMTINLVIALHHWFELSAAREDDYHKVQLAHVNTNSWNILWYIPEIRVSCVRGLLLCSTCAIQHYTVKQVLMTDRLDDKGLLRQSATWEFVSCFCNACHGSQQHTVILMWLITWMSYLYVYQHSWSDT